MERKFVHLYGIAFALAGFTLWVVVDTAMKVIGSAHLPFYAIAGLIGFFAASTLALYYAPRGQLAVLWPKNPRTQILRGVISFACLAANTFALNHLSLTIFYVVVFTSPMLIAILASYFLREHLDALKIAAIIVGFIGVVIAIDPWNQFGGGDWIGYTAAGCASLFFAVGTVMLRATSQTETVQSICFMTGLVEAVLGCGLMLWHFLPMSPVVLATLAVMGVLNVSGNLCNAVALRMTKAATVEQFHYTQIVLGALFGYVIWNDVPSLTTVGGIAVIIASGLYVAAAHHQDARRTAAALVAEAPETP